MRLPVLGVMPSIRVMQFPANAHSHAHIHVDSNVGAMECHSFSFAIFDQSFVIVLEEQLQLHSGALAAKPNRLRPLSDHAHAPKVIGSWPAQRTAPGIKPLATAQTSL